jgi:hypothetical protein
MPVTAFFRTFMIDVFMFEEWKQLEVGMLKDIYHGQECLHVSPGCKSKTLICTVFKTMPDRTLVS